MFEMRLHNFGATARCQTKTISDFGSFAPVDLTLAGGNIYGVVSDFGLGGWPLTWAIGGRVHYSTGTIFLNDIEVTPSVLQRSACFVGEKSYQQGLFGLIHTTPKSCIEKYINHNKLPFTCEDVRKMFELTPERFERNIRYAGVEIYRISMAIGAVQQRKIFCFPWMNREDASSLDSFSRCFEFLVESGCFVIIPSGNETALAKICTKMIKPDSEGVFKL